MSAFTVSKTHIDVLICAGLELVHYSPMRWYDPSDVQFRDPITLDHLSADAVGQMLWHENYRSVNYRYDEDELAPGYSYKRPGHTPDPLVVLKAIACYEYQSCEHPQWHQSAAKALCEALRDAMINVLPGYRDAAGWGIEDDDPNPGHTTTKESNA